MAVGCSSAYQSQLYLEVDHCLPLQWTDLKLRQEPLPQQRVLLLMQTQFREWSNLLTSSTLFACVQLTKRWSAWWSSLWRYKEGCIQRITAVFKRPVDLHKKLFLDDLMLMLTQVQLLLLSFLSYYEYFSLIVQSSKKIGVSKVYMRIWSSGFYRFYESLNLVITSSGIILQINSITVEFFDDLQRWMEHPYSCFRPWKSL